MLLEKNNEEVKKPEQKCLVLFFHNKNKKEQNISFSCAFFPQQKQKRDGKFLDFMDHALSPISLFPNYEIFSSNFKGSKQGCPWPLRPET